jgi:hypothetical protein
MSNGLQSRYGTTQRLQAEEAEREALRWAGPFGYAVLSLLRMGDHYSDSDFLALVERGRREMGQGSGYDLPLVSGSMPAQPVPDASHAVAGMVVDPSPGEGYYRRTTNAAKPQVRPVQTGRPGSPAQPQGKRDPSGRYVRRAT